MSLPTNNWRSLTITPLYKNTYQQDYFRKRPNLFLKLKLKSELATES